MGWCWIGGSVLICARSEHDWYPFPRYSSYPKRIRATPKRLTWDANYPMPRQHNSWSCSVYSYAWVIQATATDPSLTYDQALNIIGYPNCVNETYGLMSSQCMINAFAYYGLKSTELWCSFDTAYSIMEQTTGVINPTSMYHFMAMRGVDSSGLWVANSAPGYMGVYDALSRSQFNSLGPVKLIYLEP